MKPVKAFAIIVICVGIAAFLLVRESRRQSGRTEDAKRTLSQFFYCGDCGKEFIGKGGTLDAVCPECGRKTTITRVKKKCNRCGLEFVRFEFDSSANMMRAPGGHWGNPDSLSRACPNCGSNDLSSVNPVQ